MVYVFFVALVIIYGSVMYVFIQNQRALTKSLEEQDRLLKELTRLCKKVQR